jgi:hypothetical protein
MIRGMHGLFYSSDAEATRAFFRDVLRLPGKDSGGGWWIFDFAEADLGVHPIDNGGTAGDHDVSFYCDDIHGTVADLTARGVTFDMDVADHGYGLVTYLTAPGGVRIQLYEPRYKRLAPLKKVRAAVKRRAAAPVRAVKKAVAKARAKLTRKPVRAAKRAVPSKTTPKRKPAKRAASAKARRR